MSRINEFLPIPCTKYTELPLIPVLMYFTNGLLFSIEKTMARDQVSSPTGHEKSAVKWVPG